MKLFGTNYGGFYSPENFCELLEAKGFNLVNLKKYANGAACLFIADRI